MQYKVNDLFYKCESKNTRNGFAHVITIVNKFDEPILSSRTNYYNRTWECYEYQSAMQQAQAKLEKFFDKCRKGKEWCNYRWENWEKYNFDNEPPRATLS